MDRRPKPKISEFRTKSPEEMKNLGENLATSVRFPSCMYFSGDLGVGKTTIIQGILRGLGVKDPVLSPTFSILEPYEGTDRCPILHIDLFRIESEEELLLIGLEDYKSQAYAWFVEWPENGLGVLPAPDVRVTMAHDGSGRRVTVEYLS